MTGAACEVPVTAFAHDPVMLREVLALVEGLSPRRIVDCTVGGGGHAQALLAAYPRARLLGIDRDGEAIAAAGERLAAFATRVELVHGCFSALREVVFDHDDALADLVLADLGVSSHQLDTPARGFSWRHDAPLDLRMDPTRGVSAAELIDRLDEPELALVLHRYGEERRARRVARALKQDRPRSTTELAALVRRLVPRAADGLEPATRTFQALRLAVNDELGELAALLAAVPDVLAEDGRVVLISFHSLEDRAVKQALAREAQGCVCPPRLPACACGHTPTLEVITRKPLRPRADEIARNARAQSARLRAARRLPRSA